MSSLHIEPTIRPDDSWKRVVESRAYATRPDGVRSFCVAGMRRSPRRQHARISACGILTLLVLAACGRATSSAPPQQPGASSLLLDPANAAWRRAAPPVSQLRFETTKGVFVLELVRAWGPIGADRLYNLARLGYYDDTRIHRVRAGYIAQWGLHGDSAVNAAWKGRYIADDPPRSRNSRGTFAFSYEGPGRENTRNTQIYVNLAENPRNDVEPFTVLGTVVEGMGVLDSLYAGYGEESGSGVRQGKQGPLERGGNALMDREYPKLDRIMRVTVAALVAPAMLAARASSAREPRDGNVLVFERFADIFGGRLVAAFEAIPAERYGYRPTPPQQTIGHIAQHLEHANYGLCERMGETKHPRTAKDSLADTVKAQWPKDTLVARLKSSLRFCSAALERVTHLHPPALTNTLLTFQTDLAEHYSQVATYMRLLGMVPPSAVPPRQRLSITLPAAALSPLVGVYQLAPGLEFYVTLRDGALIIRSTAGGDTVPLRPESADEFFVSEADAQVTFTRDASGAVTGFVLHQFGRDRPATKIR